MTEFIGRLLNTKEFKSCLMNEGIVLIDNLFSTETIEKWNRLLDPKFLAQGSATRSYVLGTELMELGILDELFNSKLRELTRGLITFPILQHLNVFEIAANDFIPHVFPEREGGWHSDIDELDHKGLNQGNYLSFFLYLTDVVDVNYGPFEIMTSGEAPDQNRAYPSLKVLGNAGTSFFWNREFMHRANVNRSNVRRRVLKFSIQSHLLPVDHVNRTRLAPLQNAYLEKDKFLSFLCGGGFNEPFPEKILGNTNLNPNLSFSSKSWMANSEMDLDPSKDFLRKTFFKVAGYGRKIKSKMLIAMGLQK